MKLSEDVEKVTMPGKKEVYRLFGADGNALVDLMTQPDEEPPAPNRRVLVRHPFQVLCDTAFRYCGLPLAGTDTYLSRYCAPGLSVLDVVLNGKERIG